MGEIGSGSANEARREDELLSYRRVMLLLVLPSFRLRHCKGRDVLRLSIRIAPPSGCG